MNYERRWQISVPHTETPLLTWRGSRMWRTGWPALSFLVYQKAMTRIQFTGCQPSVYRYPEGHEQHCFSTPPSQPRTTSKTVSMNRPRLVHVRFGSMDDKLRVVRARSQLKGTTIFLNEDLTKPEQEQKKRLLQKLKALRAKNIKSVHFRRAVLYFQSNHSPTRKWRNCYRRLVHLTAWISIPQPRR